MNIHQKLLMHSINELRQQTAQLSIHNFGLNDFEIFVKAGFPNDVMLPNVGVSNTGEVLLTWYVDEGSIQIIFEGFGEFTLAEFSSSDPYEIAPMIDRPVSKGFPYSLKRYVPKGPLQ